MPGDPDLSRFGGGIDRETVSDEGVVIDSGQSRADGAGISEQCIALTDDGDRCSNAVSHMTDDPFCSPHSRADDVQVIDDAE